MAPPICTFCGQYQAVFMGTSMDDGETFCACGLCLPGVMLGMTAAVVQDMSADEAQSHGDAFNALLAVYTPPAPAKSSRKRSAPPVATEPVEQDPRDGPMAGDQPLIDECPNCGQMVEVTAGGEFNCPACTPLHVTNSAG